MFIFYVRDSRETTKGGRMPLKEYFKHAYIVYNKGFFLTSFVPRLTKESVAS